MFSENKIFKNIIGDGRSKLIIGGKCRTYTGIIQTYTLYETKIIVSEGPDCDIRKMEANIVKIINTDGYLFEFGLKTYTSDRKNRYMTFSLYGVYDYVLRYMLHRDIPPGGCELMCSAEISNGYLVVKL